MTRYVDLHGAWHERPADADAEWRLGGYGLIERAGRLLMVQPVYTTGWTWDLPGGGIRLMPEETILEGIAREVYEETGYRFRPNPATLQHTGDLYFRTRRGRYLRHITFIARGELPDAPDPAWERPDDEIVQVAWVDPSTLRKGDVHWHHWKILARLGLIAEES